MPDDKPVAVPDLIERKAVLDALRQESLAWSARFSVDGAWRREAFLVAVSLIEHLPTYRDERRCETCVWWGEEYGMYSEHDCRVPCVYGPRTDMVTTTPDHLCAAWQPKEDAK